MIDFLRNLVWRLMGYRSGAPLNLNDYERYMREWSGKIRESQQQHATEVQAAIAAQMRMLYTHLEEMHRQESEESKDRVINVRLVKDE